jgi:hypothetical protein
MAKYLHFRLQLISADSGAVINGTGGAAQVCTTGTGTKAAIYDKTGAALTNPIQMTDGSIDFYTLDTVASVDIYGISPGGHAFVKRGQAAPGQQEIRINPHDRAQVALIPFSGVDSTAAAEKDTGFDLPVNCMVSPHLGIEVLGAQAKTMDFGILASETGDADGFAVGIDLTTAGSVLAKSASTATRGALIGAGTLDRGHVVASGKQSVSYTTQSGTTTANGLLVIPYTLPIATT